MSKQDESFRSSEQLIKGSNRGSAEPKRGSCAPGPVQRPGVERKRQGLGKPNLIYVKNFISVDDPVERHFLKCQNDTSGSVERTSLEVSKGHRTNTDMNHTEYSDTDSILPSGSDRRMDGKDTYQKYYDYFSEHLNISQLKKDYP